MIEVDTGPLRDSKLTLPSLDAGLQTKKAAICPYLMRRRDSKGFAAGFASVPINRIRCHQAFVCKHPDGVHARLRLDGIFRASSEQTKEYVR